MSASAPASSTLSLKYSKEFDLELFLGNGDLIRFILVIGELA